MQLPRFPWNYNSYQKIKKKKKQKRKPQTYRSLPNFKNMNWSTNSSVQITLNSLLCSLPLVPETQMGSFEITPPYSPIHNFFSLLVPVTGPEVVISASPSPAQPPLMLRKTGGDGWAHCHDPPASRPCSGAELPMSSLQPASISPHQAESLPTVLRDVNNLSVSTVIDTRLTLGTKSM